MDYQNDRTPAEFEDVAARLRAERTTASPHELDRIKLRVMQRADRETRLSTVAHQKGKLMKSRFALMLVIATGMVMGTAGVTMAVSGNSGSDSAANNQYSPAGTGGGGDDNNVLGGGDSGGDGGNVADPSAQLTTASTDSGSLPFSGLAAIPLVVLGSVLLVGGLVLRVRLEREQS